MQPESVYAKPCLPDDQDELCVMEVRPSLPGNNTGEWKAVESYALIPGNVYEFRHKHRSHSGIWTPWAGSYPTRVQGGPVPH